MAFCDTCIDCIVKFYVLIERIVFWGCLFFGDGVIYRGTQFYFVREEASGVDLHGKVVLFVIVHTAGIERLVNGAEAGCLDVCSHIESGDIGYSKVYVPFCRPSSGVIEFCDFELIDPYGAILYYRCVVAYTDQHHPYVA